MGESICEYMERSLLYGAFGRDFRLPPVEVEPEDRGLIESCDLLLGGNGRQ